MLQHLADQLLNPFDNTPLDTRQVKPGPFIIAAPMRVAGNFQHLNCLKAMLAQDDVRDKTTDDFLSYSKLVESANRQQQLPDVLILLQKNLLYEVYQELNVGVDPSSSIGFIRDLLTGQSAGKTYERPLLKTIIELCKSHPGTSLNSMMIMLAARPAGSHSKDVQTLMTFYNDWADESADVDANMETGQTGEAQRVASGCSGPKWSTVKILAIGGLVFLSRAGAATASPTPWSSRTVFAAATTSLLFLSSSPVYGVLEITKNPQSQNVTEGKELVLEAVVANLDPKHNYRMEWTKYNARIRPGSRITVRENICVGKSTCQTVLKINPTVRNDSGEYRALVESVDLDVNLLSSMPAIITVLLRANDSVTLTAQPVTLTAQPVTLIAQEGEDITPQINCNNTFLEAQLRMERIKIGVYSTSGIVSSLFLGSVLYWIHKQYERNRNQNPAPAPVEL